MVIFVYVDNSNVWIEGQRLSAVKKGMATDVADAMSRKICDMTWAYDFGRLYELACPSNHQVGRSILFGSRPPANDSLWERARQDGFEVKVYDRNASNKEKEVDVSLSTTLMEDSYEYMRAERNDMAVLLTGDRDYVPTVLSLQRRGLKVRVVFWEHAVARALKEAADEFIALDPALDYIGHFNGLTPQP
ncbi:NYN domain-containing protein [Streptomyces sp. NPDC012510]|uniref:NYN domain-containing protein n=1 Tax=Streptomyces sp. NPDC012510 TaxID=3364838 RepID=UPI0036E76949